MLCDKCCFEIELIVKRAREAERKSAIEDAEAELEKTLEALSFLATKELRKGKHG